MFVGFNLKVDSGNQILNFEDYIENNQFSCKNMEFCRAIADKKGYSFDKLKEYVINGDTLQGNEIENDWFPNVKADIFISHSHKDIELAKKLSVFFYFEFGLNCFIDSEVWKYAPDLLKIINDKYSEKEEVKELGILYNHEKSNLASQHVNIMLATALHKMIDKTEVVILLDTPNSLCNVDDIFRKAETYSPWIYSEVVCTQIVRHKELYMYRGEKATGHICESMMHYDSDLMVKYNFSTDHLMPLTLADLLNWAKLWEEKKYEHSRGRYTEPLDYLYIQKKIISNS